MHRVIYHWIVVQMSIVCVCVLGGTNKVGMMHESKGQHIIAKPHPYIFFTLQLVHGSLPKMHHKFTNSYWWFMVVALSLGHLLYGLGMRYIIVYRLRGRGNRGSLAQAPMQTVLKLDRKVRQRGPSYIGLCEIKCALKFVSASEQHKSKAKKIKEEKQNATEPLKELKHWVGIDSYK